jgi:hypothetical protein
VERLTRFALAQWRVTLLLVVLSIVGGAFTYANQPSQEDPEIVIRTAVVSVASPGLAVERIEQLLVEPIEEGRQADRRGRPRRVRGGSRQREDPGRARPDRRRPEAGLGRAAQQDRRPATGPSGEHDRTGRQRRLRPGRRDDARALGRRVRDVRPARRSAADPRSPLGPLAGRPRRSLRHPGRTHLAAIRPRDPRPARPRAASGPGRDRAAEPDPALGHALHRRRHAARPRTERRPADARGARSRPDPDAERKPRLRAGPRRGRARLRRSASATGPLRRPAGRRPRRLDAPERRHQGLRAAGRRAARARARRDPRRHEPRDHHPPAPDRRRVRRRGDLEPRPDAPHGPDRRDALSRAPRRRHRRDDRAAHDLPDPGRHAPVRDSAPPRLDRRGHHRPRPARRQRRRDHGGHQEAHRRRRSPPRSCARREPDPRRPAADLDVDHDPGLPPPHARARRDGRVPARARPGRGDHAARQLDALDHGDPAALRPLPSGTADAGCPGGVGRADRERLDSGRTERRRAMAGRLRERARDAAPPARRLPRRDRPALLRLARRFVAGAVGAAAAVGTGAVRREARAPGRGASERETLRVTQRLARWLADESIHPEIRSSVFYVADGGPRFFLALSPLDPAPPRRLRRRQHPHERRRRDRALARRGFPRRADARRPRLDRAALPRKRAARNARDPRLRSERRRALRGRSEDRGDLRLRAGDPRDPQRLGESGAPDRSPRRSGPQSPGGASRRIRSRGPSRRASTASGSRTIARAIA